MDIGRFINFTQFPHKPYWGDVADENRLITIINRCMINIQHSVAMLSVSLSLTHLSPPPSSSFPWADWCCLQHFDFCLHLVWPKIEIGNKIICWSLIEDLWAEWMLRQIVNVKWSLFPGKWVSKLQPIIYIYPLGCKLHSYSIRMVHKKQIEEVSCQSPCFSSLLLFFQCRSQRFMPFMQLPINIIRIFSKEEPFPKDCCARKPL